MCDIVFSFCLASSLSRLHSSEALASSSPPPAITCRWGVSNGPWPPLYSTSPLSFSHNKPPALSCRSSDKIIPPLFHLPLLPTLPCGAQAWPRGDRKWVFVTVISLPLPSLFAQRLPSPSSAHTWNGSQIISSTVSVLRQLLSLLVTSITPASDHWSTLSGPSSIIPILPHSGSHHSASGVCPRLTSLLQPISRRIIFLPLVCGGTIGTSRCHSVSHLSQEEETRRWRPSPGSVLAKCMFISDWPDEWEEPSVIPSPRSVCFPLITVPLRSAPHHKPDANRQRRVCVCMCVSLSVFVCVGFMVSVMWGKS